MELSSPDTHTRGAHTSVRSGNHLDHAAQRPLATRDTALTSSTKVADLQVAGLSHPFAPAGQSRHILTKSPSPELISERLTLSPGSPARRVAILEQSRWQTAGRTPQQQLTRRQSLQTAGLC